MSSIVKSLFSFAAPIWILRKESDHQSSQSSVPPLATEGEYFNREYRYLCTCMCMRALVYLRVCLCMFVCACVCTNASNCRLR